MNFEGEYPTQAEVDRANTNSGRCGKALSTGQPCPDHPVPDNARRERYAAAIRRICYNAYAAGIAPETPEYEIAADAAMAVADEEQQEIADACMRFNQNSSQRAKIDRVRQVLDSDPGWSRPELERRLRKALGDD